MEKKRTLSALVGRFLVIALVVAASLGVNPIPVAATDPYFTIVALPDTQFYSQDYPATFANQTAWINATAVTENIVFTVHLGDIVDNWDNTTQWDNAKAATDTLLTNLRPFAVCPGNHDSSSGNFTNYNSYYNYTDFELGANGQLQLGHYPVGTNENNYSVVSALGQNYLIIGLSTTLPNTATYAWINGVIATYPTYPCIIFLHENIDEYGEYRDYGILLYDNVFKWHSNIIAVLNGHNLSDIGGTRSSVVGTKKNTIWNMMADYQSWANGGDGYLRLYKFTPATHTLDVKTYSTTLGTYITDDANQFTVTYGGSVTSSTPYPFFFSGAESGIVTVGSSPGNLNSVWTTVSAGVATNSTVYHNGAYSYEFKSVAATQFLRKTMCSTVVVGTFAFYVASWNNNIEGQIMRVSNAAGSSFIALDSAAVDHKLCARVYTGTRQYSASELVLGQWYVIDFKIDSTGATTTLDWKIDGVSQTQATLVQAPTPPTAIAFGVCDTAYTANLLFDDILYSTVSADYPIGGVKILGYSPDSSGSHSFVAGDFQDDDNNEITSPSGVVSTFIDEVPITSTADYIKQVVISDVETQNGTYVQPTSYIRFGFANTTDANNAIGVQLFSSQHAAGTSTSWVSLYLDDGGSLGWAYQNSNVNSASISYNSRCYPLAPSGGAWTQTKLKAVAARWGYASAITSVPYLDGAMLEVAWLIPPSVTTLTATPVSYFTATLNGNLTSMGSASSVDVSFEYGLDTGYGDTTTPETLTASGLFSAPIAGLTANTTYHFRAIAVGSYQENGTDLTLDTSIIYITIVTLDATNITHSGAILRANLTDTGPYATNSTYFEWGATTAYGNTLGLANRAVGEFNSTLAVSELPRTVHYRAIVDGGNPGADKSFTMPYFTDSLVGLTIALRIAPALLLVALLFGGYTIGYVQLKRVQGPGAVVYGAIGIALVLAMYYVIVLAIIRLLNGMG